VPKQSLVVSEKVAAKPGKTHLRKEGKNYLKLPKETE